MPKISVTFYGEPSLNRKRPWYKIPCEIEDFSFAFDYQQGEIRMKSKIGSIIARNYFMRYHRQLYFSLNIYSELQLSIFLVPAVDVQPHIMKRIATGKLF